VNLLVPRLQAFGGDGMLTLLLSNLVLALTAGLSLAWPFLHVIRIARAAGTTAPQNSVLVVLGMRLENGSLAADYLSRLARVVRLCKADDSCNILVVGGVTDDSHVSEASRGREYLVSCGILPGRIFTEDASCHTLENLRNAREILKTKGFDRITIITSRYHLARSEIIAKGLGLRAHLCGAENGFALTIKQIPCLLLEGYYIHWYYTGAIWSRLTGNRKSLGRIN